MQSSRSLWTSIGIIALVTTILCMGGLVYAINDILNPQPGNLGEGPITPQPQDELLNRTNIQLVALGDSLTKGTGDQTGKGYIGNVRDLLEQQTGKPVHIIGNYAVNGYTTPQMLDDLRTKQTISTTLAKADVILFTAGGNDLFAIARDLYDAGSDNLDPDKVKERMPEPMKRFGEMAEFLHNVNPKAIKIYVGVYNPFYDMDTTRQLSQHVQEWNTGAFQALNKYPNMIFVPTFDLFQLQFSKYIYSDHFHPNQAGYVRIAERVADVLK